MPILGAGFWAIALTSEKILIPLREFRGDTGWKVRKGGLLEAPDGRTEFPMTNVRGEIIGSQSYYLDPDVVVVKISRKARP